MSGSEAESDFDSDFDDFNEAVVHTRTTEVEEGTKFTEDTLSNPQLFDKRLDTLLSTLFPIPANQNESRGVSKGASSDLLSDRSQQVFGQLSRLPYLLPPNWTKLKIRYNLLLRLGIPINLDELISDGTSSSSSHNLQGVDTAIIRGRRPSGSSHLDGGTHIDWDGIEIPPIEAIPVEEVELIKTTTSEVLSNIELGMLNHSSEKFLLDSDMAVVDEKLAQFQHFYNQLLKLASVWMGEIASCQGEFETYETVIQSVIGYSQKLKREEILHKLQRQ